MPVREQATLVQKAAMLDTVREHPKGITIADMADIYGVNYHTARNYLRELVEDGQITYSPFRKGKSALFITVDMSTMPKLGDKPLWPIVRKHSVKGEAGIEAQGPYANAYRRFIYYSSELFKFASYQDKAIPNSPVVKPSDLYDLRRRLRINIEATEELLRAQKSMLENPNLWDVSTFSKTLLGDPETPVNPEDVADSSIRLNDLFLNQRYLEKF